MSAPIHHRANVRFHHHLESLSGALALLAASSLACAEDGAPAARVPLELRYTEYGIVHIKSADYESVGFGQGYAQARDNLCQLERGMLGLRGELARHFGAGTEGSSFSSAGDSVATDLYFRGINTSGVIEQQLTQPPPLGPRSEVREMVRGFVEGFNTFLGEEHELSCSGAPWLQPMSEIDVYRRAYALTLLMGQGGYFSGGIVNAEPPSSSSPQQRAPAATLSAAAASTKLPGSNAIALGAQASASGGGINVANPHLPWDGDPRWWQAQLTIPGQLDVSGAAVLGLPLLAMGHTDSVSWSITTAEQARRFTIFELTLLEGEPTTYVIDGAPEPMLRRDVSIEVKQADGSLQTVTRTQWWTRFGPVVGAGTALTLPPWHAGDGEQPGHAYVMADANAHNLRLLDTLFAFNHAHSTGDVLAAIRETQGVPWWTVLAADAAGDTLWSQLQVLPNVSDEHAARCNTAAGRDVFAATGYAILDGSRSECGWQTDADAVQPGIFGPGSLAQPTLPFVRSARYLENSNDSHWLPSADVRISGMPRILGAEASERSLRTRGLITQLEQQLASAPLDRQAVQELVLSNRSYSADLVVADTVRFCRQLADGGARDSQGQLVTVAAACEVLAAWDHHMDADSPGALLFTRYWTKALELANTLGVSPWQVPFDASDPVHTPRTLDTTASAGAAPFVATALADAVTELNTAGIPLAALLGDYQYAERDGQRLPIGGGTDTLGVINMISASFGPDGFAEPFYGSGYLHVVAFDGDPCPDAVTLLTYSQSSEPSSPHHSDQTELYSQKQWVTERFCEQDILASPELEVVRFE